jgi:tripartite-type tricarboxylate transporter receptor subunit TctC
LAEAGVKGYESLAWYGLMAPAATPRAIVERLNQAVRQALDLPEVRDQLARLGSQPVASTPEHFAQFIRSEHAKWGPIVKSTGAVVD